MLYSLRIIPEHDVIQRVGIREQSKMQDLKCRGHPHKSWHWIAQEKGVVGVAGQVQAE